MAEVLIAGCGYVGSALASLLSNNGHRVLALRREPDGLPEELTAISCDLTVQTSVQSLPTTSHYAIFCASPGAASEGAYYETYVQGLSYLLTHLERCPDLRHVFFLSSTSVYHQMDGTWIDEDSPAEPTKYTGQLTLKAESLLSESRLATTALRCGGIYGPARTRLIDTVRNGSIELPLQDRFTNRIHRDDIAAAIVHLIGMADPLPERLLLVDNDPALYSEVLYHLADELKCSRPQTNPRAPALRRGGNKRCSNRRLLNLGYELIYPSFREGYASLL